MPPLNVDAIFDQELQSVVDEVARFTTIAIRIEDEAIKSKKITGVLKIGNVDLMLEGIEGPWASG